jgi:hypothetical protein
VFSTHRILTDASLNVFLQNDTFRIHRIYHPLTVESPLVP